MKIVHCVYRTSILQVLALLIFGLSAIWALVSSILLSRIYQDSWVLAGIWLPVFILLSSYAVYISLENNLSHITLLTSAVAFLLNALPALKYHFVYGSSVDPAVHYDLIRTITLTRQVDLGSSYASTPGFQALVATLARFSMGPPAVWSKFLPAFLGALVPIGFYMLCRRSPMSASITKLVIVLSAFCLPLLYRLNGTIFTVPLVIYLVIFLFLRLLADPQSGQRLSYILLTLLLLLVIIFWHPSSTLIISFTFIITGSIFSLWPDRNRTFLPLAGTTGSLGLICIIVALTYWMFSADFVWLKFVDNIRLALQADLTQEPVPTRIYEIPLPDRILVFSFYHARDAVFLALSSIGIILLFISRSRGKLTRFLRTYTVLWLAFLGILVIVLISEFGAQGYRRFLYYLVALSPPLAGYGLWCILVWLRKVIPHQMVSLPAGFLLIAIFLLACMQLYPYQPIMPTFSEKDTEDGNFPVLYIHQVNSLQQYLMLDFALNQLPTENQLITDYFGSRQAMLFFNRQVRDRARRTINQRPEPAFLLLHLPGSAGAYAEQAEYRSPAVIHSWIDHPNMSKIYDNSGSFILFSPHNAKTPFTLEADK